MEKSSVSLERLFNPRSIAVVGASTEPGKIGGTPIDLLKRSGYSGAIWPVNPNAQTVQGLPAFASLAAIPGSVDLAIVAVPARLALAAVAECVTKGVGAIVMFTSGLGEIGGEGLALQNEIAATCAAAGIRLLGPNSLGLFSPPDGVFATFSTSLANTWPTAGSIAIASQSGAVGSYCYAMMFDRGLGISRFIATGNEADLTIADCVDWLADDPLTKTIVVYMEGCRDGDAIRRALRKASEAGKPVIVMKAGATDAGAAAVVSHTGALAGSASAYAAAFREAGACQVDSMREAVDVAEALTYGVVPRGRKVAIVTPSGGIGAMLADAAAQCGFVSPPLPQATQERIRALIPFASATNPVDTTAQVAANLSLLTDIQAMVFEEGGYDIVVTFLAHLGRDERLMEGLLPVLAATRARHPGIACIVCSLFPEAMKRRLREAGILAYEEPSHAIAVMRALARLSAGPSPQVGPVAGPRLALPDAALDEAAAKALLVQAGIVFAPEQAARSEPDAVDAARQVGFPVALKILSPDIAHKSEVGGVRLGLRDEREVAEAWRQMMATVGARAPQARIEGVLVSRMIVGGVETVIGSQVDPAFGPLVMFGLGGVFVEVFRDVVFRSAPVDRRGALEMIGEIRAAALLTQGFRGKPPVDVEALADTLVRVSEIAAANAATVASIELNPFIALPAGGFAVDALIIRR